MSAAQLFGIRQRFVLWITGKMAAELQKFETALQVIGAKAHWIDMEPDHPNRSVAIGEMYSLFAEVMGMQTWHGGPMSEERAVETIIQKLRNVLGIDELTELREALVSQALKNARS